MTEVALLAGFGIGVLLVVRRGIKPKAAKARAYPSGAALRIFIERSSDLLASRRRRGR